MQLNVGMSMGVDIVRVSATVTTIEVSASLMSVALPAPTTTVNLKRSIICRSTGGGSRISRFSHPRCRWTRSAGSFLCGPARD